MTFRDPRHGARNGPRVCGERWKQLKRGSGINRSEGSRPDFPTLFCRKFD